MQLNRRTFLQNAFVTGTGLVVGTALQSSPALAQTQNLGISLRQLWIVLRTEDRDGASTNANIFLEFLQSGKSIRLPDQPGNDLSQATSTSYLFNVTNLGTADFVRGSVLLRNDNTGDGAPWRCESVLIIGIGEDGKYYLLVAMSNVNRWLSASDSEGLTLLLDILKPEEIGARTS
jgi:hypothetical protein